MRNGHSNRLSILIVGLYAIEACPIITLQLARSFILQGHFVTVILPSTVSNKDDWRKIDGLEIKWVSLECSNVLKKLINVIWFILQSFLSGHRNQFDVTFFTFFHTLNLAVTLPFDTGKKVLFLHDPVMHSDEPERRQKKAANQVKKMDKLVVHSESFIIPTLNKYHFPEQSVCYMPLCLFHERVDLESALSRIKKDHPIHFLFFGRVTGYKGIEVLIDAYGRLEKNGYSCSLTIAGSGDFSKYIDGFGLLRNGNLINRYIEEKEIDGLFMQENCIVVVPYVDATQSGIIDLALSYAVPVIASDLVGLVEQLDSGKLGLLVPPGDSQALYLAMERLLTDKSLMRSETIGMHNHANKLDWLCESEKLIVKLGL